MSEVVKFPYNACRRVHSRKPRRSFNGTPEERAAKAADAMPAPAPNIVQLARKPVEPHTPPTPEETAYFMSLYDQLDPNGQAEIADMLRSMRNKSRK